MSWLTAGVLLCGCALTTPSIAFERVTVTTERVLVDPASGLALGGYDPVAYFVNSEPRMGKPENEFFWNGAIWRFTNVGNLEAFRHAPAVYAPQYGGYGALAVSRGYPAQGSPLVWTVYEERLYLFASPVARAAWLQHPEGLARSGNEQWPSIERSLAR